jgi:predicted nuclease of predicted toxin-antitoxin system
MAKDANIFAAAKAAGVGTVVVTKDEDFRKLLSQHGPPPQVVWVRCANVSNPELRRILSDAWPRAAALLLHGEPLVEIRQLGAGGS